MKQQKKNFFVLEKQRLPKKTKDFGGNGISLLLIVIFAITLFAIITESISFTANPTITPNSSSRPDTTDSLSCFWNGSIDVINQEVQWFNGSVNVLNQTNVSGNSATLSSTYTIRGESWTCLVILSNDTSNINLSTQVDIKNAPPTTPVVYNSTNTNIGNTTVVYEDLLNNFTINSSDPDSDTLTYGSIASLPSGASLDANTGLFQWTPTVTSTSTNITFYATDSFGSNPGITTIKVLFTVIQVNDAPVISPALTNKSINETQVFNYQITATDEELNYPLNFTISVSPSLSLIIVNNSNTTATIMFSGNATAGYFDAGNYTINVSVKDSLNATTNSSFSLTINQVNLPPVLQNLTNQTGTQGQSFYYRFNATDADENATLNFSITTIGCNIANPWNITTLNGSQNASAAINITNLTNNNVICRNVQIIVVDDRGAEDSQDLFLNISNTNDPPIVNVLSFYSNNSDGQTNISNLVTYANAVFTYKVNATDVDSLTYEGEVLNYSDNTSLFDINLTTGIIRFTPTEADIGNFTINITVYDDEGLSSSIIMNLSIYNNTAPILSNIANVFCYEDVSCFVLINATDLENENLTFTSNNSIIFNITNNYSQNPRNSSYVSFTPTQSMVGNYSVFVSVTDIRGAQDNQTLTVVINNTNDAPSVTDFTFPQMVETHAVSFNINAVDDDYNLTSSYEYVTFSVTNLSGSLLFNISTTFSNSTNMTYGLVMFTPQLGSAGNYSINITVTDYFGLNGSRVKNFTIQPKSNAPSIIQVKPYVNLTTNATVYAFGNASVYSNVISNLSVPENISVLFALNVSDELPQSSLNFSWYLNGNLISTNQTLNRSYGFFANSTEQIFVIVQDDKFENTTFLWNVTVTNINRGPLLLNYLRNVTANGTTVFSEYLLSSFVGVHFIDPDDDINSNNQIDSGETNTLTYNVTTCDVATLSIETDSLRVEPSEIGSCTVFFTAIDTSGLTLFSNVVFVNTTDVTETTTTTTTTTTSSGGGGGGSSSRRSPIPIPIRQDDVKPVAIEIIVPEIVTAYENNSVIVPVIIQNNWNTSLKEIYLNATAEPDNVRFSFSEDYFPELLKGEKRNISLLISNYRFGEDYKVEINAKVKDPDTEDSAYLFLNTIEQSQNGKDVETKVTFAQDLLNQNPECLELNELLSKAKDELKNGGNPAEISNIVDGVIEGCKYLVSVSRKSTQKPDTIVNKLLKKENRNLLFFFAGGALAIILLITGIHIRKSRKLKLKELDEKIEVEKENEFKPYWPGQ